jgi:N-acetylglutamate synthase
MTGRVQVGCLTALAVRMLAVVRYRLELRLGPTDVGRRVVIRWRRPMDGDGEEVADVLGVLEAADGAAFTVRTASGESVVVPVERALAGKTVPPAPPRRGAHPAG